MLISIIACLFRQLSGQESPSIGNLKVFPDDNPWNWDVTSHSVHPNSDNFIESIGGHNPLHPDFGTVWNDAPNGIPYIVVNNDQPMIPIVYTAYGDESDPGPFPIPLNSQIEGGPNANGDRHVIAVDIDNAMLYELYRAFPKEGLWEAESGAKFDLSSNHLRPEEWTSADAAGLPIFPGLVRYEEVYIHGQINHALRFTAQSTQRKYIWPARHFASPSTDPNLPPMGLRFRLKADFDMTGFSEPVQVILLALKKHGMIVADNGGNWFISGAPDDRWDDDVLAELKTISGSNFEAILTVDTNGDPIYPPVASIYSKLSQRFHLISENYPNPFNSTTTIRFQLPRASRVTIKILDMLGRQLNTLVEDDLEAGWHDIQFVGVDSHGREMSSGIYLYRMETEYFSCVKKFALMK